MGLKLGTHYKLQSYIVLHKEMLFRACNSEEQIIDQKHSHDTPQILSETTSGVKLLQGKQEHSTCNSSPLIAAFMAYHIY